MVREEIEAASIEIYRFAHFDPSCPPGIGTLAERLLKTRIRIAPLRSRAELARVNNEHRIYIREGTTVERMCFEIGHELAHWWFDLTGYKPIDLERACCELGAALVAPAPFFSAVRKRIEDVPSVAAALRATQSLAALREGEVLHRPVLLVQPHRVLRRGHPWPWPRNLRKPIPGVTKVKITDEAKRVALLVG